MTSRFKLRFNRALGPALGRGLIRHCCADFQVLEILGFEPKGEGEHIYLYIRKVGANTEWVAEQLARFVNVRHFDVGYAGKKDRHAITEQWFSCWLPGNIEPDWNSLQIEGLEVLKVVRHEKKLRRGAHAGNDFKLRIRNLNLFAAVDQLEDRLALISATGFPNYFGEQRFGHEANNLHEADVLFRGKKVPRKRRSMIISAARSYLFNRKLSDWIKDGSWRDHGYSWLYGLAPHRDIEIPDMELEQDDEFVEPWCRGLKELGIKAMKRDLVVVPVGLNWERNDDILDLSFCLPNGAYATSLLRELIEYEQPPLRGNNLPGFKESSID